MKIQTCSIHQNTVCFRVVLLMIASISFSLLLANTSSAAADSRFEAVGDGVVDPMQRILKATLPVRTLN